MKIKTTTKKRGLYLSIAVIVVASTFYVLSQFGGDDEVSVQAPPSTSTSTTTNGTASHPEQSALYTNGTYLGKATDAYYGTVQVSATVLGGKLANVTFPQYPSDRSTSRQINAQAMPYLTQEAIQAQSAQVNIISGATFTSQAFQQSLASALSQAHA